MDERIVHAMRLLEQEIMDEVNFAAIASAVGLSVFRFHHLFAREAGLSPGAYLRRIRMETAAQRLRWTREEVGRIAVGVGYASQSSFTHVFTRHFRAAPGRFRQTFRQGVAAAAAPGLGPVELREFGSLPLLAKRYIGDIYAVRDYWADFEASLPGPIAAWRNATFFGLIHDDPRTAPADQIRYDCCVTTGESDDRQLRGQRVQGLQRIRTRPGRYACVDFQGPREDVEPAYRHLCDHWVTNSRYTIADDPAIEVHAVPRHRMDPGRLQFTLMLPLE